MADLLKSIGVPWFHIPEQQLCYHADIWKKIAKAYEEALKTSFLTPPAVPTEFQVRSPMLPLLEKCGGDPDGDLVPLPVKPEPVRVVPEFPLTAYKVLLK